MIVYPKELASGQLQLPYSEGRSHRCRRVIVAPPVRHHILALLRSQLCQMFYWAGENSSDTILTGERIPRAIDFESMHNYLKPNAIPCLGGGPAISAIIFLTMARPNDQKSCATMTNEPGPAITLSR